ncbi:MAG: tripartite tricarboxylate transporter substrate binding protein [Oscillospiraceae bacterium]|nr:tripartite tricarboxylate transporter substrate binding protein [Oscillospiraceae bacterium]
MKKLLATILALCMIFALTAVAASADWTPNGPVTLIIPYATGGSADTVGRLVAQYLGDQIGVQINCINKEGASGAVGSTELAHSKPDGMTIGMSSISDLYVADYRGTFDIDSLNYLVWFNSVPFALFASPESPWNDIGELVADIKAGNNKIAMAESGTAHLIGLAQMCKAAGIDMIDTVSFSSGGESQTALLGNHVDLASLTPSYIKNVTAGGGKLMAIYGSSKIEQFADYPYAIDFGMDIPAIVGTNQMISLPQGCSDEIVEFWSNALQELVNSETFQEAMLTGGYCLCNIHGEELTQAVKDNNAAVAEIMQELGLE